MIKEIAKQHEEIDYWVDRAKEIVKDYGSIIFYCDSARPEHVKRFKREGLWAVNADKSVVSGIEQVARLYKQDKLYIVDDTTRFKEEIFMYVWNEKTGEPIKLFDDVQDSIRYAIYSRIKGNNFKFG